jgi:hypothetical protein
LELQRRKEGKKGQEEGRRRKVGLSKERRREEGECVRKRMY